MRSNTLGQAALFLSLLFLSLLPFQNCAKFQFKKPEIAVTKDSALASTLSDIPVDRIPAEATQPLECKFNGLTIPEGQTRTAFQNSNVPFKKACMSEERVCLNGVLSGSYNFSSCAVAQPASCLFNGITYKHKESVRAYKMSSVAFGAPTCASISEERICDNGKLSGSFNFSTCSEGMAASCLFNGQTIGHEATVNAFQNSAVAFDQKCVMQTRSCNNGMLSGSFNFASCTVGKPSSCSFNGVTLAHGETTKAYLSSTEAFGKSCVSEIRTCDNGSLSGSNKFASCEVDKPAQCLFNGITIADGQSVKAFQTSSVPYGSSCDSQSRLCSNGILSGTSSFASCEVNKPAACLFDGKTIAHGEMVTGFASPAVAAGTVCSSEQKVCSNGTLSGKNLFSTCVVEKPVCAGGQVLVNNACVQTFKLVTIPRSLKNSRGTTQALGAYEKCIVSVSTYDGDGVGFCQVSKNAAGTWDSIIGDEGKAMAQVCSFTCSQKNTAAVLATTNSAVGASCKTSKGDGLRMTDGKCCSGTIKGYHYVQLPPPKPPKRKNIFGNVNYIGIGGAAANQSFDIGSLQRTRMQYDNDLRCE